MKNAWIYSVVVLVATALSDSVWHSPQRMSLLLAPLISALLVPAAELWGESRVWLQFCETVSVLACVLALKEEYFLWVGVVWLLIRAIRATDVNWLLPTFVWLVGLAWYGFRAPSLSVFYPAGFYAVLLFLVYVWLRRVFVSQRHLVEVNAERWRLYEEVQQNNEVLQRYNRELREITLRSQETGLWNLRGFLWNAGDRLGFCQRREHPAVLCVLDIYDIASAHSLESRLRLDLQKEMASALFDVLPEALVGHLGSERFGVLITQIDEVPEAIEELFRVVASNFGVELVMGTASFPTDSEAPSGILSVAEERLRETLSVRIAQEEENKRRNDRLSAMGTLAAGIAHEIRNPMTVVRGFIQMSQESWRDLVLAEVDRINLLVGDFLSLAKDTPTRFEVTDLRATVATTAALLEPGALLANVELLTDTGFETLLVRHDVEQFKQVIMNLVKNAVEAIGDQPDWPARRVRVMLWRQGEFAVLQVSDTGPGIPDHYLTDVFNPFFSTKDHGTGLGLAIAHQLVTAHDGEIRAFNTPAGGATFEMKFPLVPVGAPHAATQSTGV